MTRQTAHSVHAVCALALFAPFRFCKRGELALADCVPFVAVWCWRVSRHFESARHFSVRPRSAARRAGRLAKGRRPARLERRVSRQYEIGAEGATRASASSKRFQNRSGANSVSRQAERMEQPISSGSERRGGRRSFGSRPATPAASQSDLDRGNMASTRRSTSRSGAPGSDRRTGHGGPEGRTPHRQSPRGGSRRRQT